METTDAGLSGDELVAFAAVAETGSFTAASSKLGRDASVISRRVSQLERRLGVRLLVRTTRSVTLTEAGSYFLRRIRSAMDELAAANREVGHFAATPQGVLKISLPVTFGRMVVSPLLVDFLQAYPEIGVDAHFLDQTVEVVAEGFDAVIRIGVLRENSLIARKLGSFRSQLVATPAYLQARGRPESPQMLSGHECLGLPSPPSARRPNWAAFAVPRRHCREVTAMHGPEWHRSHRRSAVCPGRGRRSGRPGMPTFPRCRSCHGFACASPAAGAGLPDRPRYARSSGRTRPAPHFASATRALRSSAASTAASSARRPGVTCRACGSVPMTQGPVERWREVRRPARRAADSLPRPE